MVDTIKFSEMTNAGNINNNDIVPSLRGGENVVLNNPWNFLPSGTTAERPTPSSTVNYRLRFNTTDQLYEYYDAVLGAWTQLQESAFTAGPFIIYKADASIPDAQNLGALANGILKQSITLGVATLDIAVNGTDYWAPGDALTRTQVPSAGDDVTNKTYVDSQISGAVISVQGTANQVLANATSGTPQTGAIILTLPQNIASTSSPTFAALTLTAPLTGANGGTGVNNGASTITLGGSLSTIGAFASAFTMTGGTAVTFPTSGTLATTSQIPTGAALTKADDTNVTLTLGGTPATALLQATSLTLGWTGQLSIARGGTSVSSVTTSPTATAWAGWDANKNLSSNNFLSAYTTTATAASTTTLTVASTYAQFFTGITTQTLVMPVTSTLVLGFPFYVVNNSSGNVTVQSSGGNTIQIMAAGTTAYLTCILTSGTTASSWNCEYAFNGGEGSGTVNSGTANQLAYYATTGIAVSGLSSVNSAGLLTNGSGLPGWVAYTGTGAPVLGTAPTISNPHIDNIRDTGGNISLALTAIVTPVNYVTLFNSATLTYPGFSATGSDTNIGMNFTSKGNGAFNFYGETNQLVFQMAPVASSVNYIIGQNNTTGNNPQFAAAGSDTNIYLNLYGQGTGGVNIKGCTDGSSGNAGVDGEVISSTATSVSLSTGTAKTITSISLTAGDWDIVGVCGFTPAAGTIPTSLVSTISLTNNTLTSSASSINEGYAQIQTTFATSGYEQLPAASCIARISSTTTLYLVGSATFTVSTLVGSGVIIARRRR